MSTLVFVGLYGVVDSGVSIDSGIVPTLRVRTGTGTTVSRQPASPRNVRTHWSYGWTLESCLPTHLSVHLVQPLSTVRGNRVSVLPSYL